MDTGAVGDERSFVVPLFESLVADSLEFVTARVLFGPFPPLPQNLLLNGLPGSFPLFCVSEQDLRQQVHLRGILDQLGG